MCLVHGRCESPTQQTAHSSNDMQPSEEQQRHNSTARFNASGEDWTSSTNKQANMAELNDKLAPLHAYGRNINMLSTSTNNAMKTSKLSTTRWLHTLRFRRIVAISAMAANFTRPMTHHESKHNRCTRVPGRNCTPATIWAHVAGALLPPLDVGHMAACEVGLCEIWATRESGMRCLTNYCRGAARVSHCYGIRQTHQRCCVSCLVLLSARRLTKLPPLEVWCGLNR